VNTLTPELKQAIERAGDSPVRLTDPETQRTFVLIDAEEYERLRNDEEDRREQAAFLRAAKRNAKARLREDAGFDPVRSSWPTSRR
jgi:PHD/YefM family antitoxin component YafN of YafNO toxin-antitoxin module